MATLADLLHLLVGQRQDACGLTFGAVRPDGLRDDTFGRELAADGASLLGGGATRTGEGQRARQECCRDDNSPNPAGAGFRRTTSAGHA
jgi:hypothetical protein